MTKLSITVPTVGEKDTAAEPKVGTALSEIESFINGKNLDKENYKAGSVEEATLSTALQEKLTTRLGFVLEKKNESFEGVTEKYYQMELNGSTLTLPKPILNRIIGAVAVEPASVKITASEGAIYGDFITAATTITLTKFQHVILIANGLNWFIVAGEPKREQVYGNPAPTKAEWEAGFEVSATRPAFVYVEPQEGVKFNIQIAGHSLSNAGTNAVKALFVPPGQKLKMTEITGAFLSQGYAYILL